MKLRHVVNNSGVITGYSVKCPGCCHFHVIQTEHPGRSGPVWTFDGNLERPTFTPSVKVWWKEGGVEMVCHFNLTAGRFEFCGDCSHDLKNSVAEMVDDGLD